ncbi:hypothetical protein SAMN05443144_11570 [Fodinibius roseus]|uniref:Uncharacterized protein n=1 Tax=Fodinibius roseus TaxID=1194090 RepID=A0A1M5FLN0_9BACT|nr:hypothetical protein SAMN05443144_11570 [Fodinibius roseus]
MYEYDMIFAHVMLLSLFNVWFSLHLRKEQISWWIIRGELFRRVHTGKRLASVAGVIG